MNDALRTRGLAVVGWLALAVGTPAASLAIWLWLTHQSTSGCFGLSDGASFTTFATAVVRLASTLDPSSLACASPALLLPLVGLVALVRREPRRFLGWTLASLGFAVHALLAVALVSGGC